MFSLSISLYAFILWQNIFYPPFKRLCGREYLFLKGRGNHWLCNAVDAFWSSSVLYMHTCNIGRLQSLSVRLSIGKNRCTEQRTARCCSSWRRLKWPGMSLTLLPTCMVCQMFTLEAYLTTPCCNTGSLSDQTWSSVIIRALTQQQSHKSSFCFVCMFF